MQPAATAGLSLPPAARHARSGSTGSVGTCQVHEITLLPNPSDFPTLRLAARAQGDRVGRLRETPCTLGITHSLGAGECIKKDCGSCGNTFFAFPRSLWTRSSRPQIRQLPQSVTSRRMTTISAAALGVPRDTCTGVPAADLRPGAVAVESIQWEVCALSASTRGIRTPRRAVHSGGSDE